jgi:hypothetical protein
LELKGEMLKGRPLTIKESQRNITTNKKRQADYPLEDIKPSKKQKN